MLHYAHSGLIYSIQNMEKNHMSFNRGMNTENGHLHSSVTVGPLRMGALQPHASLYGTEG